MPCRQVAYRTSPINRARDGSCVIDITVGGDKATTLRFLGWMLAEKQISAGLGVFCRATLSEWAEEWLKALSEKGLKYSTLVRMCHMPVAAPTTPLPATAVRLQTLTLPSVAGKLLQRTLHGRPVCLPDVRDRSGRSYHAKVTVGRAAQPSCPVRVAGERTT